MIRLIALAALLALAAGCGGGGGEQEIIVGAAASLTLPLTEIGRAYEDANPGTRVRLEFAGSGVLAARIRQGAPLEVLVSADPALADDLHADGLAGPPQPVAANELVILADETSSMRTPDDLGNPGVRLAIGGDDVPVGSYARTALGRLGAEIEADALANVVTEEIDARGLTAKLEQGVVDAAIAYRTDAAPLSRDVRVIPFPTGVGPAVTYTASVIGGDPAAGEFSASLSTVSAGEFFVDAGFLAP